MKKRWKINLYKRFKRFDILPSICVEWSKWMDETNVNIYFSWLFFECIASKDYTNV
jgi:hypothetical protein